MTATLLERIDERRIVAVTPIEAAEAWIYVIECDHGVKIGLTKSDPIFRFSDLERAIGTKPTVIRVFPVPTRSEAYQVEQAAHWHFATVRTLGEWFHCHPIEAADTVQRFLKGGVPLGYYRGMPA